MVLCMSQFTLSGGVSFVDSDPVAVVFQETAQAKGRLGEWGRAAAGGGWSLGFIDVASNPNLTMCS